MAEPTVQSAQAIPVPIVTEEQRLKAEEFIALEEGAHHKFAGPWGTFLFAVAVVMSLYHLYAAYGIVTTTTLRYVHVAFTLFLVFLLFPAVKRLRHKFSWIDLICALVGVATSVYALAGGDNFLDRSTAPNTIDMVMGVALIVLVLEAARRSTGWIMPMVCVLFLVYAMAGAHLPPPWTHRGYDIDRLVGTMYMTLEGIFGTPIDVSSSLIILFTIYGAMLQFSNAGKFFIDFSLAAFGRKATGAGRAVTAASFLLGGPSGSGVATTVTLGTVAYPMLAKAGYEKNAAGGLLAAGGLGAILSPPVLGAAAFLISEFLKISYLDVIRMAIIPTCLYYFSLLLMVEIDARKHAMRQVVVETQRHGLAADEDDGLSLHLARRDHRVPAARLLADRVGVLGDGGGRAGQLSEQGQRAARSFAVHAPAAGMGRRCAAAFEIDEGARGGFGQHAQRRGHLRGGRHHRRRRHADRARPALFRHRHLLRGRKSGADRDLHRADRLGRRSRGAGDRELHHLCGGRRAGADQARRARLRSAHVHLLLRGVVRSVAADRAVAICRRGDHRRRSVQDHACSRGSTRCPRSSCRSCSCSIRWASGCCSHCPRAARGGMSLGSLHWS